ncbi:MAG: MMPL family transporter [Gammaproteobacteria bacterium]|nr:MMPL family transporter [Gammaproteobacteria bacterium]
MKDKWFRFVINHPYFVILTTILLTLAMGYGISKLTFKSDYRIFFGETNPQLLAFDKIQETYNKSDTVDFIIAPKDGQIFSANVIKAILEITKASWQIPYSTRVDSITNFQHTSSIDDDMQVEDLFFEEDLALNNNELQQKLDKIKSIALNDPMLINRLISKKAHVSIISSTIQLPEIDQSKELPEVVNFVRNMKTKFAAKYPEINFKLSGIIIMNNSFPESAQHDGQHLIPLMFLAIVLMMMFMLKSVTGTLSTVIIIISSIIGALGLAGWSGLYLSGPSASTPTIVMTLAVADCIHILSSQFYEMRHHGRNKNEALLTALHINYQPIFLTSITTAIGFLSLNFSDAPPFHDLGNMVATGVMLAFIYSISLFPALLSILPMKVAQKDEESQEIMNKISHFVVNNRKTLLPITSIIIIVLVAFVPRNELNDNFVEYFDKTVEFRQATDFMQDNIHGLGVIFFSIDSGEASGINTPKFLSMTEKFAQWMRAQPETDHVMSLSDTIKRLNKNMHGDNQDFYKLPENRELSAQYLLLYEMSLPYGLDLNNQLNVDKSALRLIVTYKNLTSNQFLDIEQRAKQWFDENGNGYTFEMASPSLMFAHIGQRNIISMLSGTSIALLIISLILGFALRSVKFGLISLLPNLIPAGIAFGLWGMMVGEVGLALSVVAGMTLGIIVDDTVHFLSKYLHARRDKAMEPVEAVHYAFASVGRALLITTIVLSIGFIVLAQSTFRLNADMGLLTSITITIALIVDFLFLPPLIILFDKNKTI